MQATLSIKIAPVPCPNAALEKAMASIVQDIWKLDTILTGVKKKTLKMREKKRWHAYKYANNDIIVMENI